MKRLITIIALALLSFGANASDSLKTRESVKIKCSLYLELFGTPAERAKESADRKAVYNTYISKGYTFSKVVKSKDGLYLEFIK